jgi:hypothetical protein
MTKIQCRCLFDITATGVTGHFKSSRIPFCDRAGQSILNEADWNRSRNQQRNWETLTQLISLRTQVIDLTNPKKINGVWEFEFATETADVYGTAEDPVGILKTDVVGVPMLLIHTNNTIKSDKLAIQGPNQNIWFEAIAVNTTLRDNHGRNH